MDSSGEVRTLRAQDIILFSFFKVVALVIVSSPKTIISVGAFKIGSFTATRVGLGCGVGAGVTGGETGAGFGGAVVVGGIALIGATCVVPTLGVGVGVAEEVFVEAKASGVPKNCATKTVCRP